MDYTSYGTDWSKTEEVAVVQQVRSESGLSREMQAGNLDLIHRRVWDIRRPLQKYQTIFLIKNKLQYS